MKELTGKEKIILQSCPQFGLPTPVMEHRFSHRKFQFDYAFLPYKVALEVEGGIWQKGGHRAQSPYGYCA